MKKFLMALAATVMTVSPIAMTQAEAAVHRTTTVQTTVKKDDRGAAHQNHGQSQKQVEQSRTVKKTTSYHRWAKGQRFDRSKAAHYTVIKSPRHYKLRAAPKGYYWARSGNDAILVAVSGGIISAVVNGTFR